MHWLLCLAAAGVALTGASGLRAAERSEPAGSAVRPAEQLEADWLRQWALRERPPRREGKQVRPDEDARGGCDGVKTGRWGFHTEREADPWWQVDLGRPTALGELRVYNRCDSRELAARARRLIVLVSSDGRAWSQAYQHDGTPFFGQPDGRPLRVPLAGRAARYVRLQLPGVSYFHLDEVEVIDAAGRNAALGRPATQSSTSRWSVAHAAAAPDRGVLARTVERGVQLARRLEQLGVDGRGAVRRLEQIAEQAAGLPDGAGGEATRKLYLAARRVIRRLALRNPLLDFDTILFIKRQPGMLPHMADQYYGWWSRPGGGLYVLENFRSDRPRLRCLTSGWPPGSFLRPDLSYDGRKVLFAYCRHYPHVAAMEKVDKDRLPEDAFYHLFEMDLDGGSVRRLTRGRYDDFDGRYLPNGDIVFLSTRKGRFVQYTPECAKLTTGRTLPDSYVRCGGDNTRPCAVFTLHRMRGDGSDIRPLSAFENFEWTPSIAADGRILYARWDYIDRFNGPFMSLWSAAPDGSNAQLVYGNYTKKPQCVFEARSVPGSRKLVFTAAAHHSTMGGSLVLLDRSRGAEGEAPLTRLTPEVPFPETEAWADHYYANPYPLSEEFFLTAWSDRRLPPHAGSRPVVDDRNPPNAMGIYLYDAFGNLELLYRDPKISSMCPLPVRPRPRPPMVASLADWRRSDFGRFLVLDVYRGLEGVARGRVAKLRIVGVPPKTQPQMNQPMLGVSREDPGKFVLGEVPVEPDGSAQFEVPAGVPFFFQAVDAEGLALQTMRSLTSASPGATRACAGCHESRDTAPPAGWPALAAARGPAPLEPPPPGAWPLRFDRLVQPVLDRRCVACHRPDGQDPAAAAVDLRPGAAYASLIDAWDGDLRKLALERDRSLPGDGVARNSRLWRLLTGEPPHHGVRLDPQDRRRFAVWMDVYAQRLGSFSAEQEAELQRLRRRWAARLEGSRVER